MTMQAGLQWRAIENALVSLVKESLGVMGVWSMSNGVQPNRPYVRLQWLSWGNIGDSSYAESFNTTTGKVERSYFASRTALLDVQCISDAERADQNSNAMADALMVSLDIAEVTSRWLAPVGVAVADFDGARNLDAVEDGAKTVSRTSFTLKLNLAVNVDAAFTAPPIETVQGTGHIEGGVKTDNGGDFTVEGE